MPEPEQTRMQHAFNRPVKLCSGSLVEGYAQLLYREPPDEFPFSQGAYELKLYIRPHGGDAIVGNTIMFSAPKDGLSSPESLTAFSRELLRTVVDAVVAIEGNRRGAA